MEFLQKTPQCIFHLTTAILPQHLGTCSVVSEPTLRLLRAGGGCNMTPASTSQWLLQSTPGSYVIQKFPT